MNLFLLQIRDSAVLKHIADSLYAAQQGGGTSTAAKMNLLDLLAKGGVIMIPLGLLLALAIFFFFERLIAINKASKIDANFMNMIRDNILSGNVSAARSLAKNTNNPVARMIDKGLQRVGKPIDYIEKSMESVGKLEIYKMERN